MSEAVKVIVRCRPMNEKEQRMRCKNIVRVEECKVYLENPGDSKAPEKTFVFDNAYDASSNNETIYSEICYSLVESVLEGYNSTIFAYGQTGCGKSHTMQGPIISSLVDNMGSDEPNLRQQTKSNGIISHSFEHLFEAISVSTDVRYLVLVSYLEIYNENVRDLLNNNSGTNLKLKEIPSEGIVVENLSKHPVHNVAECENLLLMGSKNRKVGSTLMNAGSSRSHSIFIINVEQISKSNDLGNDLIKKGKLNLVDLAGSERQTKTGATGDQMKEATKINLSLSALGNVISALVDGKTKHIPYRDSKLTRLLQDSLGGNTKTLKVACISPADYNYEETLSTLRYAARAKNIKNKPKINEDPKDAMLREYQEEIAALRRKLETTAMNGGTGELMEMPDNRIDVEEQIQREKERIELEFEEKARQMRTQHEQQKKEKEELIRNMEQLKHEYEMKLKEVTENTKLTEVPVKADLNEEINITDRIKSIKDILIGGERANDTQLKEKRYKKKLAAQKKLKTLTNVISRIEQTEDRDLLQAHYSDIHQELVAKTDLLKQQRQKIRALEREIVDIQGEFQLDRADYLESIRRLDQKNKFFDQFFEKITPILRRDGRTWNLDQIKAESTWNDDLKKWRIPDSLMSHIKLPPALSNSPGFDNSGRESTSLTAPARLENSDGATDSESSQESKEDDVDIAVAYFRPKRAAELIQQNRNWKEMAQRNNLKGNFNVSMDENDSHLMNKTWYGGSLTNYFKNNNTYYKQFTNPWNINNTTNHRPNMW